MFVVLWRLLCPRQVQTTVRVCRALPGIACCEFTGCVVACSYVYEPKFETGGRFWALAANRMVVGFMLAELLLAFVMIHKVGFKHAARSRDTGITAGVVCVRVFMNCRRRMHRRCVWHRCW